MISGRASIFFFLQADHRFDDGSEPACLQNLGVGDREATATMPEHGVHLVKLLDSTERSAAGLTPQLTCATSR